MALEHSTNGEIYGIKYRSTTADYELRSSDEMPLDDLICTFGVSEGVEEFDATFIAAVFGDGSHIVFCRDSLDDFKTLESPIGSIFARELSWEVEDFLDVQPGVLTPREERAYQMIRAILTWGEE